MALFCNYCSLSISFAVIIDILFLIRLKNPIFFANIHTYIIGHYNPSVRIIDLVSHTTCVVCVNFIHKWRDLQFKVDFERQIF